MVIQELTRQSKIHEQSIHSTATKTIIETSREYFSISIYSRKRQASFYSVNVLVLHNCAARNLSHELTFQPIARCCRDLGAKANMFCIIRASSQTQSHWKECSNSGSGSGFPGFPYARSECSFKELKPFQIFCNRRSEQNYYPQRWKWELSETRT